MQTHRFLVCCPQVMKALYIPFSWEKGWNPVYLRLQFARNRRKKSGLCDGFRCKWHPDEICTECGVSSMSGEIYARVDEACDCTMRDSHVWRTFLCSGSSDAVKCGEWCGRGAVHTSEKPDFEAFCMHGLLEWSCLHLIFFKMNYDYRILLHLLAMNSIILCISTKIWSCSYST